MCGITGIIGKKKLGQEILEKVFIATDTIKHRGPDNQETVIGDSWAFGHTRLSVIDTSSSANQPMTINDGNLTIVYNGEIYNHLAIRSQLQQKGVEFQTESDTETILSAYSIFGKDMLSELNGFFSFCIYDKAKDEFFLARDRYGIKPLLYSIQEDYIAFASELKALLKFPIPKELNHHALGTYLQLSYIPAPSSIYTSISKLLPGQCLTINHDRDLTFSQYYSIEPALSDDSVDFRSAAQRVKQLTFESVERRLISDVPLGSFLSGGVDSSIIAYCANQIKPIDTFTIAFKNEPFFDESRYARLVSKHIGSNHHEIDISDLDLLEIQTESQNNMDEPFADSSAIAVNALSRFTKNHVTVALSGDGADELFSGYNKHEALYKSMQGGISKVAIKTAGPLLDILPGGRNSGSANLIRKAKKYKQGIGLNLKDRYLLWAKFTSREKAAELLQNFQEISEDDLISEVRNFNEILLNDFNLVLQNDMLKKVDSMSMINSLEVRTPFLDHHLVDYVFGLPSSYKIKGGDRKILLKSAFKNELPAEIFNRRKQGFEVPLERWFNGPLKSTINQLLLNKETIEDQGIFNYTAISDLFSKNIGRNQDTIWALLQFQIWHSQHQDVLC